MNIDGLHDNLMRRSEALHQLISLMRSLPMELTTPPPKIRSPLDVDRHLVVVPEVALVDHWLVCGEKRIDLSRKILMRRLFECFTSAADYEVGRDDIVQAVYAERDLTNCSERLIESLQQNTVKLISRAREQLEREFGVQLVDWLVYAQESRRWQLYRLKSGFFAAH